MKSLKVAFQLVFNAHRVYGDVRWPLLAAGWDFIGVFLGNDPTFHENVIRFNGPIGHKQYVYVLRKKCSAKFC